MKIQEISYTVKVDDALLWQYNAASALEYLVLSKQDWINTNQTQFWQNWYDDVFNLETANPFGLSVWSIILGMPLFLAPDPNGDKPIWGFGQYHANFDNGNFSNQNRNITLTVEEQRLVLRLRYYQLTTRAALPDVNVFLAYLFEPYGQVYMVDTLKMSINYVFHFAPPADLLAVIKDYDLLPRPTGVGIKYVDLTRLTWGFGEYHKNFDNGTFIED